MVETLVAVNKAGLDRVDGNVCPRVELEAVDTTASDPRESGGRSLGEGNKAIRSSDDQVSWLLREGRGIRKEQLAIDNLSYQHELIYQVPYRGPQIRSDPKPYKYTTPHHVNNSTSLSKYLSDSGIGLVT